jgi:hypothetical protein
VLRSKPEIIKALTGRILIEATAFREVGGEVAAVDSCKSGRHPQIIVMVGPARSHDVFSIERVDQPMDDDGGEAGCLDDCPLEQPV